MLAVRVVVCGEIIESLDCMSDVLNTHCAQGLDASRHHHLSALEGRSKRVIQGSDTESALGF